MVISVKRISPDGLDKYDVIDSALIPSKSFKRNFGDKADYIEAHLYTNDDRLILSDYRITDYTIPGNYKPGTTNVINSIGLDPAKFIQSKGYSVGTFKVEYHVFRKKISDVVDKVFFIKEISADRTEIRLSTNNISDQNIESGVLNFLYDIQSAPYFKDFILNFGENKLVNATNIALDKNSSPFTILVKLYQPLPAEFTEKSSLWIVDELSDPHVFQVELGIDIVPKTVPMLKSANFSIEVDSEGVRSSEYTNINGLFNNSDLSTYQKIINRLDNPGIQLSTDYSDYSNFIHFSSAFERLINFVYKIQTIEGYNASINSLTNVPNYSSSVNVSSSIYNIQNNINAIIQKFDGYEQYLYYTSASTSWPKLGTYPSFSLYPSTSSTVTNWLGSFDSTSPVYGGQIYTASAYDNENQNNLVYCVPEFIGNDPNSSSYLLFLNMIGQHFDNIWIYQKAVTDLYKNNNSFVGGISKDLVFNALRSLGIKLYNSNTNKNIFEYLIGATSSGSYLPMSSSFFTTVSASQFANSGQDISKEYFKRIYHNLPMLLKSKGSNRGIKALISTFGIPQTVLDIVEYGGSDKFSNTLEYSYDRFTYALQNTGSSFVKTLWPMVRYNRTNGDNFLINPEAIEFRINPDKNNIKQNVTLLEKATGGIPQLGITMNYTSSNNIPSANISLVISGSLGAVSSSLTLPVYITGSDGNTLWWNFLLKRRFQNINESPTFNQYYDLYVENEITGQIGQQASASLFVTDPSYNSAWSYFGTTASLPYLYLGGTDATSSIFLSGSNFIGNIQELRIWTENISKASFDFHTLNPESIEGNTTSSAYEFLSDYYPLGGNLLTYNNFLTSSVYSVHPKYGNPYLRTFPYDYQFGYDTLTSASYNFVTPAIAAVYSASSNIINFYNFPNIINYKSFDEIYYTNVPNSGYYGAVTDKIRISGVSVSGSVLSPYIRQESTDIYRTKDVHYADISFSPQSKIDKDIVSQYGSTLNIDNLIGDPADNSLDNYPQLNILRDQYYAKYFSKFNFKDFIRLISFFDNSMFKMIKDNVPARSNISTGITIKPTLLNRNKLPRREPIIDATYIPYSASLGRVSFSIDSSYTSSYLDGTDFYTGQLSGSLIDYHSGFDIKNKNIYNSFLNKLDNENFNRSSYNVLINNVSESIKSIIYQQQDLYNKSILTTAYLQDGYYNYRRHINPRYEGSKSTSAIYNFYTPGDSSYGKNAAIDSNTIKFAFLNQANTRNLNFFDKTSLNIKYLIDASGSITELSRRNYNLVEVQNMFRTGDDVTVSLLDAYNPTNQTSLEGNKKIWQGGYSFSPIVYREIDENLAFDYLQPTAFTTSRLGIKAVAASTIFSHQHDHLGPESADNGNDVKLLVDGVEQPGAIFALTNKTSYPNNTWPYQAQIPVYYGGNYRDAQGNIFTANQIAADQLEATSYWKTLDYFLPNTTAAAKGGYVTSDFSTSMNTVINSTDRYVSFTAPRNSTYTINANIPINMFCGNNETVGQSVFKLVGIVEKQIPGGWTYVTNTKMRAISFDSGVYYVAEDVSSIWNDFASPNPFRADLFINNFQVTLNQGDVVRFKLFIIEQRPFYGKLAGIDFTIMSGDGTIGFFEMYDNITSLTKPVSTIVIADDGSPQFFGVNPPNYNTIVFSNSASLAYDVTRFTISGSQISDRYSDITTPFHFSPGDIVRFGSFFQYNTNFFTITNVIPPVITVAGSGSYAVSSSLQVVLDRNVSPSQINTKAFAFLHKQEDETSVILSFTKSDGISSAGALIPFNLRLDIRNDVANIISPLKQKLLANVIII